MKNFTLVSVLLAVICFTCAASADSITKGMVEKKLHHDFATADQVQVTELKENFWGLYRNYQVSFKARFAEGVLHVSCNLDAPRANDMTLRDCSAKDHKGEAVDVARYYGKENRMPASH